VTLAGPVDRHQQFEGTYFLPQERTCSSESVTHLTTELHGATIQNRGLIFAPEVPNGFRWRRQPYLIDSFKDAVVCYFLAMREQQHRNLYNLLATTKQTARKETGETEVLHTLARARAHTHTYTYTHIQVDSMYICASTAYADLKPSPPRKNRSSQCVYITLKRGPVLFF
jgi:hypothetical protein